MDGTGNWSHATHAYRTVYDFARRVDENLAVDLARDLEAGVESATSETRAQTERDTWHALIANASLAVSRIEQSRLDYVAGPPLPRRRPTCFRLRSGMPSSCGRSGCKRHQGCALAT